ncbi:MAG: response regulator [Chloroflexia bacterium]
MSKILIVDDEPALVDVLEEHLQSEGYDTVHAYSGEESLAMLAKFVPDLVILDLMLPGMDGYEVCRLMQADVRLNHIPVIMLTARDSIPYKVLGYERGADDYIVKPFQPDELSVRVRAQLHHLYHDSVSELTGLPGAEAVENRINEVVSDNTGAWTIVYVDIADFTAYNESYSFVEGDEMINMAARALKRSISEAGGGTSSNSDDEGDYDFVGHTGGDKFTLVVGISRVEAIRESAQKLFAESTADFYTPADRQQGYLIVLNRQGMMTHSNLCKLRFDIVGSE